MAESAAIKRGRFGPRCDVYGGPSSFLLLHVQEASVCDAGGGRWVASEFLSEFRGIESKR